MGPEIARRIRGKKRLVLFLDFDGTLVRIAPMPESVRPRTRDQGSSAKNWRGIAT